MFNNLSDSLINRKLTDSHSITQLKKLLINIEKTDSPHFLREILLNNKYGIDEKLEAIRNPNFPVDTKSYLLSLDNKLIERTLLYFGRLDSSDLQVYKSFHYHDEWATMVGIPLLPTDVIDYIALNTFDNQTLLFCLTHENLSPHVRETIFNTLKTILSHNFLVTHYEQNSAKEEMLDFVICFSSIANFEENFTKKYYDFFKQSGSETRNCLQATFATVLDYLPSPILDEIIDKNYFPQLENEILGSIAMNPEVSSFLIEKIWFKLQEKETKDNLGLDHVFQIYGNIVSNPKTSSEFLSKVATNVINEGEYYSEVDKKYFFSSILLNPNVSEELCLSISGYVGFRRNLGTFLGKYNSRESFSENFPVIFAKV